MAAKSNTLKTATKKKKKALTPKQELFCREYVLRMGNATKAYRESYDVSEDTTEASIAGMAHKTLKLQHIKDRINEIKQETFTGYAISVQQRVEILSDLAQLGDTRAIDILNKMEGVYIEKVEHSTKSGNFIINLTPVAK